MTSLARFVSRLARDLWRWSRPLSGQPGASAHDRSSSASATRSRRSWARRATFFLLVALTGACRQDLHDQPKYRPLRGSELFADKRSARPLVEGAVARGTLREDVAFYAGQTTDGFVSEIPVRVTADLLARGQSQYQVFCSPCHARTGRGDGMVVQRGFKKPSSYHVDRLRQMPIGY